MALLKKSKKFNSTKGIEQSFWKMDIYQKADGTKWIDIKFWAMEKVLEIKGFVNKWKDAGYLMLIAIFIDIFSLMCQLSLSLQLDKHDPHQT